MSPKLDAGEVRFFHGRSHPELAAKIAAYLEVPLEKTYFARFSNDNMYVQLGATVRGRSVYILQSLIPPVNDHLIELFIMLDIARGAGAKEVHAIIPYYSYARSDKKDAPRISITARLIADLLQTAGATHVMTMTLHSPQVHGFFSVPTDPLTARHLFARYLLERAERLNQPYNRKETVVVAPDYGRAGSAGRLAGLLGLSTISAEKIRISDTKVQIGKLILKQIKGFRRVIIYDDEIATGSTVMTLVKLLIRGGIEEIILVCTHGLFIGNALANIAQIPQIVEIITTDTVPQPAVRKSPKLTVLSVASVIGDAIYRNYTRQSIGSLFTYGEDTEEHVDQLPERQPNS